MITNSKNKTTERITCQKKTILDYLKGITSHPSAEEIYFAIRKKLPRISRGTVYRILNNLKQKGEIQEIPYDVAHYDGNTSSHAHFVCRKCNKIFDIFDVCRECKIIKRKRIKVGKIKNYNIYFYGICEKCQRRFRF